MIRYVPGAVVHHHVSADRVRLRYVAHRSWCEGISKAAISRTVGRQSALASESAYVTGVVPAGIVRQLGDGPTGWIGAGAIALSVMLAAAGYVRGRLSAGAVTARPTLVSEPAGT